MTLSYSNYPQYSVNYPQYFGSDEFKNIDMTEFIERTAIGRCWSFRGSPTSQIMVNNNMVARTNVNALRIGVPLDVDDGQILVLRLKNFEPFIMSVQNNHIAFTSNGLTIRHIIAYFDETNNDYIDVYIDASVSYIWLQVNAENFDASKDVQYKIIKQSSYKPQSQPQLQSIEEGDTE